jgi:hypothetical protein
MSANHKNTTLEELKDKKSKATGSMTAYLNGEKFMTAQNVHFIRGDLVIGLLGTGEDPNVAALLSYPIKQNAGPHVVHFPQDFEGFKDSLFWQCHSNNETHMAKSGKMTFTLRPSLHSAYGTFEFLTDDSKKITGEFDITQ